MRFLVAALFAFTAAAAGSVARADEAAPGAQPAAPSASDAGGDGFGVLASNKARVIFTAPEGVQGLSVKFDGHPVRVTTMTTRAFTIEPGIHSVSATGIRGGVEVAYEARFQVDPGEFVRLPLPMTEVNAAPPEGPGCLSPSRTEEDVKACIAARTPAQSGCGACVVSAAQPAPPLGLMVLVPLVLIARRLTRRRRRAIDTASRSA